MINKYHSIGLGTYFSVDLISYEYINYRILVSVFAVMYLVHRTLSVCVYDATTETVHRPSVDEYERVLIKVFFAM